jgi:hypothetical protein
MLAHRLHHAWWQWSRHFLEPSLVQLFLMVDAAV